MRVEVTILSNGLTIATQVLPAIESTAIDVWINAGSRNEEEDEHGLAHLLEHMAFKGTTSRTAFDIASEIENRGGEINAGTSPETTSFHARMLAGDTPIAIDILSDILQNSVFDCDDLQREQHVVLQEIGAASDIPEDIAFTRFMETAFYNQTLGRSILGTAQTVRSLTSKQLNSFMAREYSAERMVVVGTGKVDHDSFVKEVEKKFGGFSKKKEEKKLPGAHYTGGDLRETRNLMDTQIILGFEGRACNAADFHSIQLLSSILGGGISSRLFQEIRERHGLCYSIHSFHWGFSDTGLFGIHTAACETDLEKLFSLLLKELHKLYDTIEKKELDRARAQYRAGLIMSGENVTNRAGQIARQILLFGRPISQKEIIESLETITPEDLSALSFKLFSSRPSLTAIGPVRTLLTYEKLLEELPSELASFKKTNP